MSEARASHLVYGEKGEEIAEAYLVARGWTILARRYRCKGGELDLAATKDDVLALVEVKARTTHEDDGFGPLDAVTPDKLRKFVTAARWFLAEHESELGEFFPRLDVILVEGDGVVEHLEDAFEARGG